MFDISKYFRKGANNSIEFKNVEGESEETCADPTEIKRLGWKPGIPDDDFYVN